MVGKQWGFLTVGQDSSATLTLPISMTTNTYCVAVSVISMVGNKTGKLHTITRDTTTITLTHTSWEAYYGIIIVGK